MRFQPAGPVVCGVFVIMVLLAVALPAPAQTTWVAQQITSTVSPQPGQGSQGPPAISGDGSALAFLSNSDLGGTNPLLSPELFLYRVPPETFEKVTHHDDPGGFLPTNTMRQLSHDGSLVLFTDNTFPSGMHWVLHDTVAGTQKEGPDYGVFLNPSGTFVLFFSNDDLVGENPDLSWELYRYSIPNDSYTQLTHDVVMLRMEAVGSDDGSKVVIMSPDDLVPGSNSDGSVELFLLHPADGTWTQLTSNPPGSDFWNLDLDSGGSRLVFTSSYDFTGGNPDHSSEVFLLNVSNGSIVQVTNSDSLPLDLTGSLSGDGRTIAIVTPHDLTGGNPDHNGELFIYQVSDHSLVQVTNTTGAGISLTPPAINSRGTKVAVVAGGDYAGGNPDGNGEIFLFRRPGATRPGIPADSPSSRLLLLVVIAVWGLWAASRRTGLT